LANTASQRGIASTGHEKPATNSAGSEVNTCSIWVASAEANSGEISGAVTKSPPAAESPSLRAPAT
jgi:hypothetical protein